MNDRSKRKKREKGRPARLIHLVVPVPVLCLCDKARSLRQRHCNVIIMQRRHYCPKIWKIPDLRACEIQPKLARQRALHSNKAPPGCSFSYRIP